ncbi:hypothetical protein NHQ30_004414 [Ciborinia camelliae]|nr:hypothetical protein NHQ30_004414 [Ciborinia camelliae]
MATLFSQAGSTYNCVDTPTSGQSLANRPAAITDYQTVSSGLNGARTPNTVKSFTNMLEGIENIQEPSANSCMTFDFTPETWYGTLPHPGHFAILCSGEYYLVRKELVEERADIFNKIFPEDTWKDITAVPAASLPDLHIDIFSMFIEWCRYKPRGSQALEFDRFFESQPATREERLQTIDTLLNICFFAEKYGIAEFQDETLRLFINSCKEVGSPLGLYHMRRIYDETAPTSKTRLFAINFIAYIVQVMNSERETGKPSVLACELGQCNEELLVDMLDLLEGGRVRDADGEMADQREAPECEYHQHGPGETCPLDESDSVIDSMSSLTFNEEN